MRKVKSVLLSVGGPEVHWRVQERRKYSHQKLKEILKKCV
jgi:hypothetical protein